MNGKYKILKKRKNSANRIARSKNVNATKMYALEPTKKKNERERSMQKTGLSMYCLITGKMQDLLCMFYIADK